MCSSSTAAGPPSETMLELSHLTKRYGSLEALHDLSFTVREGEIFGFVGANGAGKTTTMRVVLGVLDCDSGSVLWDGAPITFATRRRIGYIPEDRGLSAGHRPGDPRRRVHCRPVQPGRSPIATHVDIDLAWTCASSPGCNDGRRGSGRSRQVPPRRRRRGHDRLSAAAARPRVCGRAPCRPVQLDGAQGICDSRRAPRNALGAARHRRGRTRGERATSACCGRRITASTGSRDSAVPSRRVCEGHTCDGVAACCGGCSLNLLSWSWVAKELLSYVKMIWPPAACA
jgi:hypothetical protein